jgi:hypothetical protein
MASNVSVFDPATQQDISRMTEQYAGMLEPQYQQARKRLTQSLAGTGGLYGSPAQYGASNIEAARLGQIGQYGLGLSEKAQEQAWNRPFQEAALMGTYGGQKTLAGRQQDLAAQQAAMQMQYQPQLWQSQLATEAQQRELNPQQFALNKALSEAGLTGQYGGQETMTAKKLAADLANQRFQQDLDTQRLALDKALQEADLTGKYDDKETLKARQIEALLEIEKLQQEYQPKLWQEEINSSEAQRDLAKKLFGLQEAGITGKYGREETFANKLAQQEQLKALLPYILEGYLSPTSGTAMPGYSYTTEKDLTQQTPEYKLAQKYGFSSPIEMELIGAYDPDRLKRILAGQEVYGAPTTKTIPSDLKFADFEVGGRARV